MQSVTEISDKLKIDTIVKRARKIMKITRIINNLRDIILLCVRKLSRITSLKKVITFKISLLQP